jgi:hypothetical protein
MRVIPIELTNKLGVSGIRHTNLKLKRDSMAKCNECNNTRKCSGCDGKGTVRFGRLDICCGICDGTGECQICKKRIYKKKK